MGHNPTFAFTSLFANVICRQALSEFCIYHEEPYAKAAPRSPTALKTSSKCSFIPYKLRLLAGFRLVMKHDPCFCSCLQGYLIRRPTRNNLPELRSLDHIKPCSASRADRRIVHYVTVIATHKPDKNP
ncbi:MAG: hypothetical protein BECKG1743E_GA0114224_100271 [Candidatus Kentron sp. G]|nr:MAG: hypothetical protein BECKG1743E_GA0114224_100271 [Candidatus Kentron sp. G]